MDKSKSRPNRIDIHQILQGSTLDKTLKENIVHNSFTKIIYTSEIDSDAIRIFAERAYSLGYLGRHGYNLDDIYAKTMEIIPWQS